MGVWCDRLTEKLKGKVKVVFSSGRGKGSFSLSDSFHLLGRDLPWNGTFPYPTGHDLVS